MEPADYTRAPALVTQNADLPLGAVDAFVIAVAECLRITEVSPWTAATSRVVHPAHIDAFTLLPNRFLAACLSRLRSGRNGLPPPDSWPSGGTLFTRGKIQGQVMLTDQPWGRNSQRPDAGVDLTLTTRM